MNARLTRSKYIQVMLASTRIAPSRVVQRVRAGRPKKVAARKTLPCKICNLLRYSAAPQQDYCWLAGWLRDYALRTAIYSSETRIAPTECGWVRLPATPPHGKLCSSKLCSDVISGTLVNYRCWLRTAMLTAVRRVHRRSRAVHGLAPGCAIRGTETRSLLWLLLQLTISYCSDRYMPAKHHIVA